MKNTSWQYAALLTSIALTCVSATLAEGELFSDCTLDQAKQQAQQAHKLVLVDFTASWCPPCQKMESTTWTNQSVRDWLHENAIAVQVDVDRDRKTSAALNIEAMPTIIVFVPEKSNKEVGRQVGYMSPAELLRWLDAAKSGKSAEDLKKHANDDNAIWERISKARQLLLSKQNDLALQEYLWLWANVSKDDATFADIRTKAIPIEMRQLCAVFPEAKTKFAELRDSAEKSGDRGNWLILNGVLEDNARTLAWFDKAKTDAKQREEITKNSQQLETCLFANARWADAATYLYPDPLRKIKELYKSAEAMKKPGPDTEVSAAFDPFPNMVLPLYGAYVGAGRDSDAKAIAEECLSLDDTPAMHQLLESMEKSMQTARRALKK